MLRANLTFHAVDLSTCLSLNCDTNRSYFTISSMKFILHLETLYGNSQKAITQTEVTDKFRREGEKGEEE